MNKPAIYHLAFNAAGIFTGLIVVGYIAYSLFHTNVEPACTQTYPAPLRFSLTSANGEPLSPIQLQARAGMREWGMSENATVVPEAGVPGGAALQVQLAGSAAEETGARAANGVSFRWSPPGIGKARSACLSYRVWLPEDFAFEDGGILPGLFGGVPAAEAAEASDATRFGTRAAWGHDGTAGLEVAQAGISPFRVRQRDFALQQGRWIRIEQEIVLNTPGKADGHARLWVDGSSKADAAKLTFRRDETEAIAGVLADVGYLKAPAKPGMLRLSPFDLSWR